MAKPQDAPAVHTDPAQKPIGPSFVQELAAAGLAGLPFSWTPDGLLFFDEDMNPNQVAAVLAVRAAHDPTKPAGDPPGLAVAKARVGGIMGPIHDALDAILTLL